MSKPNPEVDAYVDRAAQWRTEMEKLRAILLDSGLTEELKWRQPCYTLEGSNIAIIQSFKPHCCLMFFKGTLLDDDHGVLVPPGENSRAAMRIEFTSPDRVAELEPAIRDYVDQAVSAEKAGLTVDLEDADDLEHPEELTDRLNDDPDLAAAFDALTPGRRRAWVLHFSGAKQSKTRMARIERSKEKILAGMGPNER